MTPSPHGSARTEVNDLRNIVDRLDQLMGASTTPGAQTSDASEVDAAVADLVERLGSLEDEVAELRTLVNHLMTIATWQAKVTATLVGEDVAADDDEVAQPSDAPRDPAGEREQPAAGDRNSGPASHGPGTVALDDDIDTILGTDRTSSARRTPPPDFGI